MKELKNQQQPTEKIQGKLLAIKFIHTLVWIFFNGVIFYLFYAVVTNQINKWVWIGIGLFALEGIILLVFGMKCPLTVMAKKYSNSYKDNFDIFLPNWLAKYTKLIYITFLAIILIILAFQLLKK
jgi:hypothetical protein